jgi:hypothetical protein
MENNKKMCHFPILIFMTLDKRPKGKAALFPGTESVPNFFLSANLICDVVPKHLNADTFCPEFW